MKSLSLGFLILAVVSISQGADRRPSIFGGLFGPRKSSNNTSQFSTGGITAMKCKKCSVPFSAENLVQFEDARKCDSSRLYLQNDLMKLSPVFREKRAVEDSAQFPVACIVHAQRTFTFKVKEKPEDEVPTIWAGYQKPYSGFAKCETIDSEPTRGQMMPCVTPEYSYSVYNAFSDVTDCFGINGKKLLPKFWNESGFHMNALGGGFDAGVGQLTKSAIQEVLSKPFSGDDRTALEIFKASAMLSEKASCKRLIEYEKAFDVVSMEAVNRCSIMATPENPVRNLVYMGVFYKLNERFVADRMEKSGMKQKAIDLGLTEPDMEYFKDVILTLSFNAGRGTAFSLVETFLKGRLANGQKVSKKDLDFLNANIDDIRLIRKEPKDETPEARDKRIAKLTQVRDNAHLKNLPQYLRLMHGIAADFEVDPAKKRISGAPGYVSFVAERQKKFDTELGNDVCTQPDFLQHK